MVGVAKFFKSSSNYLMILILGKKMPPTLLLSLSCYSECFIRVFIWRNESPESPQLDIDL